MKIKLLFFSLILLATGGSLLAQQPTTTIFGSGAPGGQVAYIAGTHYVDQSQNPAVLYVCTSVSVAVGPTPPAGTQTCNWTVVAGGITSVSSLPATCTPGSTNPVLLSTGANGGFNPCVATNQFSSLSLFHAGYQGLAPQDFGAKGDWHTFFDCTISAGAAIENCTNPHFTSTAVDGGKAAELECNNTILVTTIASVQSGTQATLAATCSVTQTNTAFAFGTDDTTALRAWASAIGNQFSSTSTNPTVRAGWLPRGQYYTTKAVRWIQPTGTQGSVLDTTKGECTKISAGAIWCPLMLYGDGTWASTIVGSSNFNWAADGTSTNTGLCYVNNWSGSYITNMGCGWAMGQESGFSSNTTGQTGLVGTWVFDNNSHTKWDSNFAYAAHNAAGTLCGLCIDKDFESEYSNSAVEFSDINLIINPSGNGANVYEKMVFDTLFCEGGGGAQGNIQINSGSYKQTTFRNVHARDGSVSVNVRGSTVTTGNDALVFDRFRQTTGTAGGNLGFVVQSAVKIEFNNGYFEDTGASATGVLFTIQAGANISLYGGALKENSTTNCISATAGTPSFYAYGTQFTGCTNNTTGTMNFNAFIPTTTGWTGPGGVQGTYFLSNSGTGCAIGNFALSAGWGTTAAPTAPAGFNQSCRITITASGTGQAANPTITWTLPNALPTATTTCEAHQSGGTGAFTMVLQTTLSATAPIFTLQGTPTAAATYIYDIRCGP